MKGASFLKVTGIIMIIGGAFSIIMSIVAVVSVGALAYMLEESAGAATMLYLAAALALISSIVELVAGIVGVKNCRKPEKAVTCIVLGVIVAVLCLLGQILTVAGGASFRISSILIGLALPVLYIIGGVLNKKELSN